MSEFDDGMSCGQRVAALAAEAMATGIETGHEDCPITAVQALRALAKMLREPNAAVALVDTGETFLPVGRP